MLQNFPNFTIMSPSNKAELEDMIKFASKFEDGPLAIRFPKTEAVGTSVAYTFSKSSRVVVEGNGTLIISIGNTLDTVWEAIEISGKHPTVIDSRFVQPFDFGTFYQYAETHDKIIFIEEGIWGGLSSIVLKKLFDDGKVNLVGKIHFLNASKTPVNHSSRNEQINDSEMSATALAKLI